MEKYVEVYLVPVPKKNLKKYVTTARSYARLFKLHGALSYAEYISSDKGVHGPLLLSGRLKPKAGEVLIYSEIGYRSETHRNQVIKKAMADPKFAKLMPNPPLFKYSRMGFGGFKRLIKA
jgi:uncharacterized protein YbaA (DUF1428 family)